MLFFYLTLVFTLAVFFILVRFFYIKWKPRKRERKALPSKTLIVLGSGGHTTEMLALVRELNRERYSPRVYVIASADVTSENKALELESSAGDFEVIRIHRSRAVGQSYVTSVLTTVQSTLQCIPILLRLRPDVILCNGPGTCVPICLVAFLLKLLFINSDSKIVFIESYCRVKTISLSGKILKYFVDAFIVQWPELILVNKNSNYFGKLL